MEGSSKVQLKLYLETTFGDGDGANDQLGWYAANNSNASRRPTLTIQYTTP